MLRTAALVVALVTSACNIGAPEVTPSPSPTERPTLRILVGDAALEARSKVLAAAGLRMEAIDRPGGRGSVAVAELVNERAGDPGTLALVGSPVVTNELLGNVSPRLGETTLVARLGSEAFVLAVAPSSVVRDAKDLRDRIERDPLSLRFAGAGIGSVDHQLAALVVRGVTESVGGLAYASYPTSSDAAAAVAGGQAQIVVARYGALRELIAAQRLRALAVSSPDRLAGVELPTLREVDIEVAILDWALLTAPPRITATDLAALREAIARARGDPAWASAVRENAWVDDFATDGLLTFLGSETTRMTSALLVLRLIRER